MGQRVIVEATVRRRRRHQMVMMTRPSRSWRVRCASPEDGLLRYRH